MATRKRTGAEGKAGAGRAGTGQRERQSSGGARSRSQAHAEVRLEGFASCAPRGIDPRGVAARASPPVRGGAAVRDEERREGPGLLGLRRHEPGQPEGVPGRDPGRGAGRELLLVPRLRDESARHLQAHRVRPRVDPRATRGSQALGAGFRPPYSSVSLGLRGPAKREAPAGGRGTELRSGGSHLASSKPTGDSSEERFGELEAFLEKAARLPHELRVYEDASRFVATVEGEARRRDLLDRVFPEGPESAIFEDFFGRRSRLTSGRARSSPSGPAGRSWPTRWASARPSRRSPPPRSAPGTWGSSASSSSVRPRSSTSGRTKRDASRPARSRSSSAESGSGRPPTPPARSSR